MFVKCYKILELFDVANLANWQEKNLVPCYETSVCISICLILVVECVQDPLLCGNRHDITVYTFDVNSAVEASD
jgi:hypothetical protein